MKAMVRDDIIALETFVALRFKYEKYIDMIHQCGGYCFVDQFVEHFGGKNKGRYLAQQLEENGLISTKFFNNYKYCYLTDASIKYLIYKDDTRDFSNIKKANIPVKKITPNPSDKVLFSSALKFALIQKYPFAGKETFIKITNEVFERVYANKENKMDLVKKVIDKTVSYYDKSKVIFVVSIETGKLQMIVLDTGGDKSPNSYFLILKNYINSIQIIFKSITIIVVSISKAKGNRMIDGLNKKVEERRAKEEVLIEKYPLTSTLKSQDTSLMNPMDKQRHDEAFHREQQEIMTNKFFFENELKKLDTEFPKFEVGTINIAYYMEHYKDRIGGRANYIKPKDQSRFEALKESLKLKSD